MGAVPRASGDWLAVGLSWPSLDAGEPPVLLVELEDGCCSYVKE